MKIKQESPEEMRSTKRWSNSIGSAFTGVTVAILGHEVLDYFNTSGENPISLKALGAGAVSGFFGAAFLAVGI